MITLKEAYDKNREQSREKLIEEAKKYFEENFVILEKLDLKTLEDISSNITALENTLQPTFYKLPSLKNAIDGARSDLRSAMKGGNPGKALTQIIQFYSELSDFFRVSLPKIVNTREFADAMKNPETPLNAYKDANFFRQTFKASLNPENMSSVKRFAGWLLRGAYKTYIPYLNISNFLDEVIGLNPTQLRGITQISTRIPPPATAQGIENALASLKAQASGQPAETPTAKNPQAPQMPQAQSSGNSEDEEMGRALRKIYNTIGADALSKLIANKTPVDEIIRHVIGNAKTTAR